MKRILTVTLVAALALFAGSAYANFCARDVVPATTLLAPYVVVSMDAAGENPTFPAAGYTTYLSVTNVSSEAQIIHVNVWSADSFGVLDFNQVLSGYDVWAINFADLMSGNWEAFQTTLDGVQDSSSEYTPFEWGPDGRTAYNLQRGLPIAEDTSDLLDADVLNCTMSSLDNTAGAQYKTVVINGLSAPLFAREHTGCLLVGVNGTVPANVRAPIGSTGPDWLAGLTENPIFFYVTVDLFHQCELAFPSTTAGYFPSFPNTTGVKYENVLIGDLAYVNFSNGFSEATPAVHIESDVQARLDTFVAPRNGLTTEFMWDKVQPIDTNNSWGTYEEPLATAFGFRYYNDAPTVSSTVLLWKNRVEFTTDSDGNYVDVIDCGSYLYYAWDADERVITRGEDCPVSPCGAGFVDPNEFPFEINVVPLNNNNFDLPDKYGWMLVILPPSYGFTADVTPDEDNLFTFQYQGWAAVRIEYAGFSAGIEAATMANVHCFETQVQPVLGINFNYADGNHVPAWW